MLAGPSDSKHSMYFLETGLWSFCDLCYTTTTTPTLQMDFMLTKNSMIRPHPKSNNLKHLRVARIPPFNKWPDDSVEQLGGPDINDQLPKCLKPTDHITRSEITSVRQSLPPVDRLDSASLYDLRATSQKLLPIDSGSIIP